MRSSIHYLIPNEIDVAKLVRLDKPFVHQFQTFATHDPNKGLFGDCMRTCHAMMLGVDKEVIPNWMQFFDKDGEWLSGSAEEWHNSKWSYMNKYYTEHHGVILHNLAVDADRYDSFDYFVGVIRSCGLTNDIPIEIIGESSTYSGLNHGMVMYQGNIYDPNPLSKHHRFAGPVTPKSKEIDYRHWGISLFERAT